MRDITLAKAQDDLREMSALTAFPPGIHPGIPQADYRAADGISNSALKEFARSPMHYKYALDHPKEATKGMALGTLFHTLLLEPDNAGEGKSHIVRPDGVDMRTKDGKAWLASCDPSLPVISRDELVNLQGAREAVLANKTARWLLERPGLAEASVFARHEATGLMLKCRPDWQCDDVAGNNWILDVKTTEDASRFEWTARDFRYGTQHAFYCDQMARLGIECKFLFLVVEIVPPHGVMVVNLDNDRRDNDGKNSVDRGRDAYTRALSELAECIKNDYWPGYAESIQEPFIRP